MFEANPHGSSEFSIRIEASGVEKGSCSISDSFLIIKDLTNWRPFIGDFTMCMTILWIVDIGIDTTFEDVVVRTRLGGRLAGRSCQMYVQEGRNMA